MSSVSLFGRKLEGLFSSETPIEEKLDPVIVDAFGRSVLSNNAEAVLDALKGLRTREEQHALSNLEFHGLPVAVWACLHNSPEVLDVLKYHGADMLCKTQQFQHLTTNAETLGIDTGLFANPAVEGCFIPMYSTPLHVSAMLGHVLCTKLLLAWDVPVNARDALGHTPMFVACHSGHHQVLKAILGTEDGVKGLRLPNTASWTDSGGYAKGAIPIHAAAVKSVSCVAVILAAWRDDDSSDVRHLRLSLTNAADARGWTAVHYAAASGNIDALQLFATYDPYTKLSVVSATTTTTTTTTTAATTATTTTAATAATAAAASSFAVRSTQKVLTRFDVLSTQASKMYKIEHLGEQPTGSQNREKTDVIDLFKTVLAKKTINQTEKGSSPLLVCLRCCPAPLATEDVWFDQKATEIEMWSPRQRYLACMQLLCEISPSNLTALDVNGWGVLHWACAVRDASLLHLLLNEAVRLGSSLDVNSSATQDYKFEWINNRSVNNHTTLFEQKDDTELSGQEPHEVDWCFMRIPAGFTAYEIARSLGGMTCVELLIKAEQQADAVAFNNKRLDFFQQYVVEKLRLEKELLASSATSTSTTSSSSAVITTIATQEQKNHQVQPAESFEDLGESSEFSDTDLESDYDNSATPTANGGHVNIDFQKLKLRKLVSRLRKTLRSVRLERDTESKKCSRAETNVTRLQDALNQAIYREKDAQNKLEASLSSSENREKDWIKELLSTQSRLAALKETMSKLQKKEDTSHTLKQLLQERKALENGNISLAAELMEQAQYLKSAQVDQVVAEAVQNHVLPQAGEAAELQTFTVRPKKKRNPPNKGHSTTGLGNPRGFSYIEALEAYDTMTSEERHNAHVNSAGMDDKYRDNCLQESCRGEEDDDGCVVM